MADNGKPVSSSIGELIDDCLQAANQPSSGVPFSKVSGALDLKSSQQSPKKPTRKRDDNQQ